MSGRCILICCVRVVLVPVVAWLTPLVLAPRIGIGFVVWGLRQWISEIGLVLFDRNPSYQRFLDKYPTMRFRPDLINRELHGSCPAFRVPEFLARFDWLLDHNPNEVDKPKIGRDLWFWNELLCRNRGHRRFRDPHTVFAGPHSVSKLLDAAASDFDNRRADRIVIFAGSDKFVSDAFGTNDAERTGTVRQLKMYFRSIFVTAADVHVEGLMTFPLGLTEHYFRRSGVAMAQVAIESAALSMKSKSVLAAWGAFHETINTTDGWTHQGVRISHESRRHAREWCQSRRAQEVGVDLRQVDSSSWWSELPKYRFLLAPLGSGIQSPKPLEALLVLTVPIVKPYGIAYGDLVSRTGLPLVIVDTWDEVGQSGRLEAWWKTLAPRLEHFRRTCLTTEGFWHMATSEGMHCS